MDVTVVIATHNRADELTGTLERLRALPERPPVIVVDNASGDGTVERVRASHPWVSVIALVRNLGAAGRNVGVRQASTPYVALSDDDSWWSAGALPRATALLDEHPDVGLVAAHILVGPNHRPDPTCLLMRDSRLPAMNGVPGAPVLGFLGCAAVVRRSAFLAAGGFEPRLGIGAEEALLAIDLARAGWHMIYRDDVVAHHWPSPTRDSGRRDRLLTRNELWINWLRRPLSVAWSRTLATARRAIADPAARAGLLDALTGSGWVLRERQVVEPDLERRLRVLERAQPSQ